MSPETAVQQQPLLRLGLLMALEPIEYEPCSHVDTRKGWEEGSRAAALQKQPRKRLYFPMFTNPARSQPRPEALGLVSTEVPAALLH